jgi:ribosomal protein S18 acetylase RimI-like enzyme
MTVISALEACAFNAWPARQTVFYEGWILRLANGYTKRANSANAWQPTASFDAVRSYVEALYQRQGLPTIFRLTPLAGDEPDRQLEVAGYQQVDPTEVMTLPVGNWRGSGDAILEPMRSSTWSDGFALLNGLNALHRQQHDALLDTIAWPVAYATVYEEGQPIGYGLAVAEGDWAGLFDVVVAPAWRGRGHGRQLVKQLIEWGETQGARQAYLQVTCSNSAALALYRSLGFETRYRYHYRVLS